MIFDRFGVPCVVVRLATAEDVHALDRREPDAHDLRRIADSAYLVTRRVDDGAECVHDAAYLRADHGLTEIARAVREAERACWRDDSR